MVILSIPCVLSMILFTINLNLCSFQYLSIVFQNGLDILPQFPRVGGDLSLLLLGRHQRTS